MFPPPCTTFDLQTVAVLIVAYDNAIKAQPTSVHESIAKHIIELASEGERDPHKLCLGALARSKRRPRSIG